MIHREPSPRGRTASAGSSLSSSMSRRRPLAALVLTATGLFLFLLGLISLSVPTPAAPSAASAAAAASNPALRGLVSAQGQQPSTARYEAQAFKLGDLGEADSSSGGGVRRRRRRGEELEATTAAGANTNSSVWWHRNLARTVLLIVASSERPAYLQRCLASVRAHYPEPAAIPIVISEDGASAEVQQVVDGFRRDLPAAARVIHLHHPQQGQQQQQEQWGFFSWWRRWLLHGSSSSTRDAELANQDGYQRLARHYAWALGEAFDAHAAPATAEDKVLVLEEDLDVSPDVFAYFGALAPLLDAANATNLMAVSAWHDNGMDDRVVPPPSAESLSSSSSSSRAVHRSDFFPGLGWMLARPVWEEELQPAWPAAYWDDWLRRPEQRKGRQFLRPEVSRTHHFGHRGTSNGQFSPLLDRNRLSDAPASAWDDEEAVVRELQVVKEEAAFDRAMVARVEAADEVAWGVLKLRVLLGGEQKPRLGGGGRGIRVVYDALADDWSSSPSFSSQRPSFSSIARGLGLFEDEKSGVPRAGHKGIVSTYLPPPLDARVYLVPSDWRARLSSVAEPSAAQTNVD